MNNHTPINKEQNSKNDNQFNLQNFWHQPESRWLEFKEACPSGDGIARTAVAFANGAGGKIVFGVREESRETTGISAAKNAEGKHLRADDYAFQVQFVNTEG